MSHLNQKIRFFVLLAVTALAKINAVGQETSCVPRIGLVTPEFIVFESGGTPVSILGTCLDGKTILAVPQETSTAPVELTQDASGQTPYKVTGTFVFSNPQHYTVCV